LRNWCRRRDGRTALLAILLAALPDVREVAVTYQSKYGTVATVRQIDGQVTVPTGTTGRIPTAARARRC
jgi:hypothetical protein